jgi:hypothetical protein
MGRREACYIDPLLFIGKPNVKQRETMSKATPMEETQDKYIVPGLERGLRLLGEFSSRTAPVGSGTGAAAAGAAFDGVPAAGHPEMMGFVERTDGGREFRLGMAVLRLGFDYLASLELTELGRPLLDRLRDEIHYPCNLVVRDGRSIVYVAKSVAARPFTSTVNVGTRLPAHATVLGRVLLEDLALSELRELYPESRLEVFSESTPRTVEELYEMVQRDRQRGYVLHEGFFEASISTIAAPVRDRTRRVVAALGRRFRRHGSIRRCWNRWWKGCGRRQRNSRACWITGPCRKAWWPANDNTTVAIEGTGRKACSNAARTRIRGRIRRRRQVSGPGGGCVHWRRRWQPSPWPARRTPPPARACGSSCRFRPAARPTSWPARCPWACSSARARPSSSTTSPAPTAISVSTRCGARLAMAAPGWWCRPAT